MAPGLPGSAKRAARKANPEGRMSLIEHLIEFRQRLIKAALALVVCSIIGWFLYDWVYAHLTAPMESVAAERGIEADKVALNFAGLTTAFSQRVNLSVWLGLIMASPVIMYQLWAYIVPALTKKEKRVSMAFVAVTLPLFLIGCAFGYWVLPKAVEILLSFTPVNAYNLPEAAMYFRFVTRLILVFGVTWVMPVALVGLIFAGIIPGNALFKQWRPALVLIFIISAIVTPTPDPVTMFFMAGPLIVLYFIAAWIGILIGRRRAKNAPDWTKYADDEASPL
ncbi:Sec-independent protein translocase protein TatC [Nostocoides australiense Ben110]|uniref:Sec-independent protein translocase protein TatC n=1 Tax=Nostocoides australiense Ben110 TaxID=1193182 RepID=W6JVA5_9MICO|nr:twin-arginine translocase subunit TatC [Tetrasphaera australiensis]CCH72576.1 Sec-independent protein translocase protein TatC [Tetrasphaera australiensis Ben110]